MAEDLGVQFLRVHAPCLTMFHINDQVDPGKRFSSAGGIVPKCILYCTDEIDSLSLLFIHTDRSKKYVLEEAGVDYARFAQLPRRKVALRAADLTAIAACFPEYRHWLVFCEELPEAGQISPMTKEAKERLGHQGKVD